MHLYIYLSIYPINLEIFMHIEENIILYIRTYYIGGYKRKMNDSEEILAKPSPKGIILKVKPEDCPEHFKKYEIFCTDCDQLLCVKCVTAHDTGHNLTDLDSLIENFVVESEIGRNSFNQRITELDDLAIEAKRTKDGILGTFEDFEQKITEEQEYIQGIQTQFITYEQDLGLMKETQQIIQAFHKKDEIQAMREISEINMRTKIDEINNQAESLKASLESVKSFIVTQILPKKRKEMGVRYKERVREKETKTPSKIIKSIKTRKEKSTDIPIPTTNTTSEEVAEEEYEKVEGKDSKTKSKGRGKGKQSKSKSKGTTSTNKKGRRKVVEEEEKELGEGEESPEAVPFEFTVEFPEEAPETKDVYLW